MTPTFLKLCSAPGPLLLLALLAGCGSGGGPAPTISALSITPVEAKVGQMNTLTGNLTASDPDGDEAEINVSIKVPTGQSQALPPTMLQGMSLTTPEPVAFVLLFVPPSAGAYVVTVHCTDAEGNASNDLSAMVTAK